jgi:hypothetical protein
MEHLLLSVFFAILPRLTIWPCTFMGHTYLLFQSELQCIKSDPVTACTSLNIHHTEKCFRQTSHISMGSIIYAIFNFFIYEEPRLRKFINFILATANVL